MSEYCLFCGPEPRVPLHAKCGSCQHDLIVDSRPTRWVVFTNLTPLTAYCRFCEP